MTSADQFYRELLELSAGKVRLDLEVLSIAFQQVHPELATTPAARNKLRELLDRLQLIERIELPKGREHWDVSALSALPRWAKLPRETESSAQPDLRSIPWAPELRFLASARVFVPVTDLLKVQAFLAGGGRSKRMVPIKERSLQIFGDEKRLDQLMRGSSLFGAGRLTLSVLRCFLAPEPLAWSPGPNLNRPLLAIENAATWHFYCRWNAERKLFSAVVYGCGNRFVDGIGYLAEIFTKLGGTRSVLYFGDLDPQGLLIPQEASARAQAAALPKISPHVWSYRTLLKLAEGLGQSWDGEPPSSTICDWLEDCAEPVRQLFATRKRLAQEHVGWEFLHGAIQKVLVDIIRQP